MNKGLFVVFEGADSSGKTTLSREVARQASSTFRIPLDKINLTSEPSDSVEGQRIRYLLSQGVPSDEFLDLFIKDRKIHVEREVIPTLQEGGLVLCDRYKYSTICYQSLQGHSVERLIELNQSFPVPDVTFILDLGTDVNVVSERLKGKTDCFDKLLLYQEVRLNYLELPKLLPQETFVFLDAMLPIEKLVENVWNHLVLL